MSRTLKSLLVGAFIGLLGALFGLTPIGTEFEQDFALPWLFKLRGVVEPPDEVAIVAINGTTGAEMQRIMADESDARLNRLGRLPRDWPRIVHARLVEQLTSAGANVIVFDMDFNRPKLVVDDSRFGRAIAESGRVILFERLTGKRQPLKAADGSSNGFVWIERRLSPIDVLAEHSIGMGPFPLPKLDEALYQFWAFKPSASDSATIPSLALQALALRHAPGMTDWAVDRGLMNPLETAIRPVSEMAQRIRDGLTAAPDVMAKVLRELGEQPVGRVPAGQDQWLAALLELYAGPDTRFLNFYGPPGTIRTVPYQAVMEAEPAQLRALGLEGAVVFVGYSDLFDPGQPDRFYTVFTRDDGVDLSGVEIAATAFSNLLTRRSLRLAESLPAGLVMLLFGFLAGFGLYRFAAHVSVPTILAMSIGYGAVVHWLFNTQAFWLPLAVPMLFQLPLALLVGLLAQFWLERRQKLQISEAVRYYIPESVVDQLSDKSIEQGAGNQVVYATCLATDMAGFTTLGEEMAADELADFMNDYFDALSHPLRKHGVTVTEFRADAIMCAWTAEAEQHDIRERAILAAMEAVDAVVAFSQRRNRPLTSRIGLDAGWVYVGHAGGGGHFVYSIVGDSANTAARVESLNKQLGTKVLATGPVVDGIDCVLTRPLGEFIFVGKETPIAVFELVSTQEEATDAERSRCRAFADGLAWFSDHDWTKAAAAFEKYKQREGADIVTELYLERCVEYQSGRGEDSHSTAIRLDRK